MGTTECTATCTQYIQHDTFAGVLLSSAVLEGWRFGNWRKTHYLAVTSGSGDDSPDQVFLPLIMKMMTTVLVTGSWRDFECHGGT